MTNIMLSIGMIVKNEARSLEQCLQALAPLRESVPCELVIADTGSTDRTKEIAEKYADQLFDFPWVDDFSAARNAVMERCSGIWYLSIDADEYLDSDVSELVTFLREYGQDPAVVGAFIQVHNYTTADLDKNNIRSFMAARMVRMDTGIRFQGRVHEHIDIPWDEGSAKLYHTVLWHDGYVYVGPRSCLKKARRNCKLLKQELKKYPNKGILYIQLIESSENFSTKMKHIKNSFRLKKLDPAEWQLIAPIIYCHGVKTAFQLMPEEDPKEWAKKAQREFPESPFTQIDVACTMVVYYAGQKKWEEVKKLGKAYLDSFARLERGEFGMKTSSGSILECGNKRSCTLVRLYLAEAYYHLEQYKKSAEMLCSIDLNCFSSPQAEGYLSVLLKLGRKTDLTDLLGKIGACILEKEPETSLDWDRRHQMRLALEKAFQAGWNAEEEDERPPYALLALLNDSVFAPCAKAMQAQTQDAIMDFLSELTDWMWVPPAVFFHIMEHEGEIPNEFFRQASMERITTIVKSLPALMDDFDEKALSYSRTCPEDANLGRVVWSAGLILEACIMHDWRKHDDFGMELYQCCCHMTDRYLKAFYHPQILQTAGAAQMLPEVQRAGWYLVQAERARSGGDLASFVHILKEMLQKLPSWKEMIGFLGDYYAPSNAPLKLDRTELEEKHDSVSQELLALAEQVKAILAQFPANHPAVKALKMSPAYQKVAALIEDAK